MFTHLFRVADPTPHASFARDPFRELDSWLLDWVQPRRRVRAATDDVADRGDHYRVALNVPGLRAQDLHIEATEDELTIRGERELSVPEGFVARRRERSPYTVSRTFSFPNKIDPDAVEATFENGVLTVSLAKGADAKPRSITVRSSAA